jgi:hypothetical protein
MLFGEYIKNIPTCVHRKQWFLGSGISGVMVAILLAIGLRYDRVSSGVVIMLWPAAMVQMINPKTIGAAIAVALIAYGTNFFIYGLVGAGMRFTLKRICCLLKR